MTTRAGVLGSPIAHSLSPVLHRAAYRATQLSWVYEPHDVDEDGLATFLDGLDRSWRGLSLTMPLKRRALELSTRVSETAAAVEAVNTIVFEPDGTRVGSNTDVPGMVSVFRDHGVTTPSAVVVLGGGATARSTVAALAELGIREAVVAARTPARAVAVEVVAERVGVSVRLVTWSDLTSAVPDLGGALVVSTVPAAASAAAAALLRPRPDTIVFDALYDPWPTALAIAAGHAGAHVIGGLDLLVAQAALQFSAMTGLPAPIAVMAEAGRAALAARRAGASASGDSA